MMDDLNSIDITVKKETHNIEYVVIVPVSLIVLLFFRYFNIMLPQEYIIALFGVTFYTPLTWAIVDIYSLFKTGGRYTYKIEIETYNIILEALFGLIAYIIAELTSYLIGYIPLSRLFSVQSIVYFMVAYIGVTIARFFDRKLIKMGGNDNITLAFLSTFLYLMLFSYLFFKVVVT